MSLFSTYLTKSYNSFKLYSFHVIHKDRSDLSHSRQSLREFTVSFNCHLYHMLTRLSFIFKWMCLSLQYPWLNPKSFCLINPMLPAHYYLLPNSWYHGPPVRTSSLALHAGYPLGWTPSVCMDKLTVLSLSTIWRSVARTANKHNAVPLRDSPWTVCLPTVLAVMRKRKNGESK